MTGTRVLVVERPGVQHAHPARCNLEEARGALLSDGNFVEADVASLARPIAEALGQLGPQQELVVRPSGVSGEFRLFVDGGRLIVTHVDDGVERQRSTYALDPRAASVASFAAPTPAPAAPAATPAPGEPTPRAPVRAAGQPQNLALVIGVQHYRDLPEVLHARSDAERMAAYFRDVLQLPDDHVVLLTDENASLTDINKYIEGWLPRMAAHADRLYFYFAGHGSPDVTNGSAHLLPYDGDPRFLGQSALDVSKLYQRLAHAGPGEVVVMLDACFSGAGGRSVLPRGARPLVRVQLGPKPPPALVVMAAAGADQITGEYAKGDSGLFTYFMLQALGGEADADGDGRITADELMRFVRPRVERQARSENREQAPQLMLGNGHLKPAELVILRVGGQ